MESSAKTDRERLEQIERALLAIYDGLPPFVKATLLLKKTPDGESVVQLIEAMRQHANSAQD